MRAHKQNVRQRLVYQSDVSDSVSAEVFEKRPAIVDIISYLAIAVAWQVDIIPYTWLPNLGHIGRGQSGTIQQSIANLQTSFAFKTFDGLTVEAAFEEASSEIHILGNPTIREHPNIIHLEGICWNILPKGEILPVLVFEKTDLGNLSNFMELNSVDPPPITTRLRLSVDVIRAVCKLHLCC